MIRSHLNARHDEFVREVAWWCLEHGWFVRVSAQERAGTMRFTPDLDVRMGAGRRVWVECKVASKNIAIAVDEFLLQRSLKQPVVVAARVGISDHGFVLQRTIPDWIAIPVSASAELRDAALRIAREFRVPGRIIHEVDAAEGSNIPFLVYSPVRFQHWQSVLERLAR